MPLPHNDSASRPYPRRPAVCYNLHMMKMNARELRTTPVDPGVSVSIPKHAITIVLDSVLDTYNIGSLFRLADAMAVEKVYLTGMTETPPNTRIKKASINTWQWVPWEYQPSAVDAIAKIRAQSPEPVQVVAVEQATGSIPFYEAQYRLPLVLVVGNESTGVSPEALAAADCTIELPMFGINRSLNVMVTTGIVLYDVAKQLGL
jgi:tRNA G18 (ribose-2'-O)-methylase SpoU